MRLEDKQTGTNSVDQQWRLDPWFLVLLLQGWPIVQCGWGSRRVDLSGTKWNYMGDQGTILQSNGLGGLTRIHAIYDCLFVNSRSLKRCIYIRSIILPQYIRPTCANSVCSVHPGSL